MSDSARESQRERRRRVEQIRREYSGSRLRLDDLPDDPMTLFERWFECAISVCFEPNAMVLSTTSAKGPSSRVVLLKGLDKGGFTFYTNYESKKAVELIAQPQAALNFFWIELHRQVRVEGVAEKVAADVSDRYFKGRPRGSQLGAWASPQSSRIGDRGELEQEVDTVRRRFEAVDAIPRPDNWGGFLLRPKLIEFWQGQENRLHDRAQYTLGADGWSRARLAP